MPADIRLALGDDLAVVDGIETVTLTLKNPPLVDQVVTVINAVGEDFTDDEVSTSGGYLEYGDRKWIFEDNKLLVPNPSPPPANLPSRKPKEGDTLLDSVGTLWELLRCQQDALTLAWECVGRRAR